MPRFIPIPAGPVKFGKVSTVTISGIVTVDASPVQRTVLLFRNDDPVVIDYTISAVNGFYSFTALGNHNDKFMVLIIGRNDEYSKVFDRIQVT